jgi:hypothetical protein
LSIDDITQLQPLGSETTTEQLFCVFDADDDSCDVATDSDVMMHDENHVAVPSKSPTYTEEAMAEALKTAHATKQFPPNIEHGSEFHLEFIY